MKDVAHSVPESREEIHIQTQPSFHVGPKDFNGIQILRIGRKEDNLEPVIIGDIVNGVFSM